VADAVRAALAAVALALIAAPLAAAGDGTIEAATAQLASASWPDRLNGVYALQRMGSDAAPAAPRLFAALDDENGLVREEAAETLKRIGPPAVPLLASGLASDRDHVRHASVQILGRIGLAAEPALEALRAAQQDPSADVGEAATLAATLVAPSGVRGWTTKLAFEVRDEPEGPMWLLAAFAGLVGLITALRLRRSRAAAPAEVGLELEPDAGPDDDEQEDRPEDDDGDEDEAEDESEGADETAVEGARGASPDSGRPRRPPPQGLPHAGMGMIAILVGVVVGVVGYRNADLDERHATYLFASVWMWFGYAFVRVGVAGWWNDRRVHARLADSRVAEPWLRDRAWRRDGTGPIGAERVLPNAVPLLLWTAYLVPFHTVWRVSASWWGVWLALGVFDLLALVLLYLTAVRVWRALRAGRCFLRWQGVPVRPGGTFSARFESSRDLGNGAQADATLRCLRDRADNPRIGDEAAADAEEVWAETRTVALHSRPEGGSWAQLSFAVPESARGTDSYAARPVRWVVRIRVAAAGPDFETSFPVPVYR
jgi:hypothetical protein